jgi:hypothetical protein
VIEAFWTKVRSHGTDMTPVPFAMPKPGEPSYFNAQRIGSHDCPSCKGPLLVTADRSSTPIPPNDLEELIVVPVGPGVDPEARIAQRRGEWFWGLGVVCHKQCVGSPRPAAASAAMKISLAGAMLREGAAQIDERIKALDMPDDFNPAPELLRMAASTENVGHDISGWEEQMI